MTAPRRALILIDVQQEYFDGPLEIRYPTPASSLPRITAALDTADDAGIPVAVFQHDGGAGAPIFDPASPGFELHPEIERRRTPRWQSFTKEYGTVFAGTGLLDWLRTNSIDTITLVGYMTNNCIIASAAESETHGLVAEVLEDATGAIDIVNDAGAVDAQTVHTTIMALLHTNFAAVASVEAWIAAVADDLALPVDNLPASAAAGAERFSR